jgi:hypothetical protein
MRWGLRRQVDLGHDRKFCREPIRGFHFILKKDTFSVDIVSVEFSLSGTNNVIYIFATKTTYLRLNTANRC